MSDTATLEPTTDPATEEIELLKEERVARPKEVSVRRREDVGYVPPNIAKEAKKRIGSHLVGQAPLRGLTFEQEKRYLPEILGVDPDTREFPIQVREFWANMTIDVPFAGTILQIGLDADGEPINKLDWVRYQWLKKHMMVASNLEEMEANHILGFYIHDPEAAENKEAKDANERMAALTALIELRSTPKKMEYALRLLGNLNPSRYSEQQQLIQMENFAQKNPRRFLRVVKDKNLELRAFLSELVELQVLNKVGGSIFNYMDQTIGDSETEALHFLQNKRNSAVVNELKSKLRAAKETLPKA